MEFSTFLYFLSVSILLTLMPGPDNLYLLTKSLADGAKCGVILACGLSSGVCFHTLLVMAGVAALIQNSPTALTALKFFGAAYLLFLAAQSFKAGRTAGKISLKQADSKMSNSEIFRRGVLMNILNPKVLLFFLAFLPQFVTLNSGSTSLQILFLGFTFAFQAVIIFSLIAICAGRLRKILLNKKNLGKFFNYTETAVLILIAAGLFLTGN